jgi:hypothetical protein
MKKKKEKKKEEKKEKKNRRMLYNFRYVFKLIQTSWTGKI